MSKINKKLFIFLIFLINLLNSVNLWNLTYINLPMNKFNVLHVTLYYTRAFLSIKSTTDEIIPTLIEVTWPEDFFNIKPKVYPFRKIYSNNYDLCKDYCDNEIIQSMVTSVDRYGRLFVMDIGRNLCEPKILIYNLLYKNELIREIHFPGLNDKDLANLYIDPYGHNNGTDVTTRIYITFYQKNYFIVYSYRENKYWKFFLKEFYPCCVAKKPQNNINLSELVIRRDGTMYFFDQTNGDVFIADVYKLDYLLLMNMANKSMVLPIKKLGFLLGIPKSIVMDNKDNLYYFLPRDGAVVRWDTRFEKI